MVSDHRSPLVIFEVPWRERINIFVWPPLSDVQTIGATFVSLKTNAGKGHPTHGDLADRWNQIQSDLQGSLD